MVKSGVDKETIMITADSNGTAQKEIRNGDKDFEKLETVAVGRAHSFTRLLSKWGDCLH